MSERTIIDISNENDMPSAQCIEEESQEERDCQRAIIREYLTEPLTMLQSQYFPQGMDPAESIEFKENPETGMLSDYLRDYTGIIEKYMEKAGIRNRLIEKIDEESSEHVHQSRVFLAEHGMADLPFSQDPFDDIEEHEPELDELFDEVEEDSVISDQNEDESDNGIYSHSDTTDDSDDSDEEEDSVGTEEDANLVVNDVGEETDLAGNGRGENWWFLRLFGNIFSGRRKSKANGSAENDSETAFQEQMNEIKELSLNEFSEKCSSMDSDLRKAKFVLSGRDQEESFRLSYEKSSVPYSTEDIDVSGDIDSFWYVGWQPPFRNGHMVPLTLFCPNKTRRIYPGNQLEIPLSRFPYETFPDCVKRFLLRGTKLEDYFESNDEETQGNIEKYLKNQTFPLRYIPARPTSIVCGNSIVTFYLVFPSLCEYVYNTDPVVIEGNAPTRKRRNAGYWRYAMNQEQRTLFFEKVLTMAAKKVLDKATYQSWPTSYGDLLGNGLKMRQHNLRSDKFTLLLKEAQRIIEDAPMNSPLKAFQHFFFFVESKDLKNVTRPSDSSDDMSIFDSFTIPPKMNNNDAMMSEEDSNELEMPNLSPSNPRSMVNQSAEEQLNPGSISSEQAMEENTQSLSNVNYAQSFQLLQSAFPVIDFERILNICREDPFNKFVVDVGLEFFRKPIEGTEDSFTMLWNSKKALDIFNAHDTLKAPFDPFMYSSEASGLHAGILKRSPLSRNLGLLKLIVYHREKQPLYTYPGVRNVLDFDPVEAMQRPPLYESELSRVYSAWENMKSRSFSARMEYRIDFLTIESTSNQINQSNIDYFLDRKPFFCIPSGSLNDVKSNLLKSYDYCIQQASRNPSTNACHFIQAMLHLAGSIFRIPNRLDSDIIPFFNIKPRSRLHNWPVLDVSKVNFENLGRDPLFEHPEFSKHKRAVKIAKKLRNHQREIRLNPDKLLKIRKTNGSLAFHNGLKRMFLLKKATLISNLISETNGEVENVQQLFYYVLNRDIPDDPFNDKTVDPFEAMKRIQLQGASVLLGAEVLKVIDEISEQIIKFFIEDLWACWPVMRRSNLKDKSFIVTNAVPDWTEEFFTKTFDVCFIFKTDGWESLFKYYFTPGGHEKFPKPLLGAQYMVFLNQYFGDHLQNKPLLRNVMYRYLFDRFNKLEVLPVSEASRVWSSRSRVPYGSIRRRAYCLHLYSRRHQMSVEAEEVKKGAERLAQVSRPKKKQRNR